MSQLAIASEARAEADGLDAREITHGFDGQPVLQDVSLGIHTGEVVAVIGPSGTGKTTLLRLLAGFTQPSQGRIRIEGTELWAADEHTRLALRRRLGMVFQEPNLFAASVRRNVAYGLHIRRPWRARLAVWVRRLLGKTEMETAVKDALWTVGLDARADEQVTDLSGGERQRVAFARAMAAAPDYLLLDEPTSELDPRNTALLEEAITDARTAGFGIAIATHDMHQARRIADRVAVMIDGEIIEVGPPDRLFEEPDDDRVRAFIQGDLVY